MFERITKIFLDVAGVVTKSRWRKDEVEIKEYGSWIREGRKEYFNVF